MDTVGTQKKILYIAKSNSTYRNLAMEEYFIDYIERETQQNNSVIALFLWQSDNTIVIGKHQNAQRECNLEFVRQNNLKIARRKTGGGAVFHDSGNLNFSIIASKSLYNQENNFLMIIKALKKLGLNAVLSGRNDILIDNKKISGSAFLHHRNVSLHHGTLLINSDMDLVSNCLTPDKYKLKKHSVSSVKSRVGNISDFSPVTTEEIKSVLSKTFLEEHSEKIMVEIPVNKDILDKIESEYASEEWIFNKNLNDFYTVATVLGSLRFSVEEENNKIREIRFETDFLDTEFLEIYFEKLKNVEITKDNIRKISKQTDFDTEKNQVISQIADKLISDIVRN